MRVEMPLAMAGAWQLDPVCSQMATGTTPDEDGRNGQQSVSVGMMNKNCKYSEVDVAYLDKLQKQNQWKNHPS